ncbi:uncharacterized protein LOC132469777 isoform X1 [Gadus macrocephalus]|uniref:uncharacterized protein LOC132469777 isoform X1 n=1 Tax=Gadus macrocephalus TaxID=80720 RepID=UPI0028CB529B|nr:uncharacterized protein LOC132469777 isoform X1 [Gadus macrocephalus]
MKKASTRTETKGLQEALSKGIFFYLYYVLFVGTCFDTMKILGLMFLITVSVQLQCDRRQIKATIGEELTMACSYDQMYRYNKKYWCRGSSRRTCDVLSDSDNIVKTESKRFRILHYTSRRLFVEIRALRLEDTGVYWVGIEKPYADIMVSVDMEVTEVPVSKPDLWPLVPLAHTCWGRPVTVRCSCTRGSSVGYAWYQHSQRQNTPLLSLAESDLRLDCANVEGDSHFYCRANNTLSSQTSSSLSVEVLVVAAVNCSYVIHIQDYPMYQCALPTPTPPVTDGPQSTQMTRSEVMHQTVNINGTDQPIDSSTWMGFSLWYTVLRWTLLAVLMACLCVTRIVHMK